MTERNNGGSATGTAPSGAHADGHMAHGGDRGRGYLSGPGFIDRPVEYAVVNGVCIHAGCIDMGSVDDVRAHAVEVEREKSARQALGEAGARDGEIELRGVGLSASSEYLWPNGIVYFTINANVPNQARVQDAIDHIQANSAIRFVRRTTQANYCEIVSNGDEGWSSSAIGMRGGKQLVRYADGHSWQILVHEFYHALGVYHEQSRSDRDSFVEIKWDNIQDDAVGNFQTVPSSVDYGEYDYGSIMHYPRTSFAKDSSKPTIVPKKSGVTIGQRTGLSFGDRHTIAKIYDRYFPKGYTAVFRAGTGRHGLWVNASWDSFKAKWQEWSEQGLRLHNIHVRRSGSKTLYSGVFLPGTGAYGLWADVSWTSFKAKWQEWSGQGLRLVDLNVHRVGNEDRYTGVFLPGSGGYALWANATWDSFENKWEELSGQGLRLVNVHVHQVGDQTRYSGVFLPGSGGHALWANASWSSFTNKWQELSAAGLRLVDIGVHYVSGSPRYTGTFLAGTGGYALWGNVSYDSFVAKWEELSSQGLRLIDLEVAPAPSGLSDVADQSLRDAEGADLAGATPEPFGGLFGDEPLAPEAKGSVVDHGGVGGDAEEAAGLGGVVLPENAPSGNVRPPAASAADDDGRGLGGARPGTKPRGPANHHAPTS